MQGILGDLFVENPQIYIPCCGSTPIGTIRSTWTNLNINDSADTACARRYPQQWERVGVGRDHRAGAGGDQLRVGRRQQRQYLTSPGRVTWDVYDNAPGGAGWLGPSDRQRGYNQPVHHTLVTRRRPMTVPEPRRQAGPAPSTACVARCNPGESRFTVLPGRRRSTVRPASENRPLASRGQTYSGLPTGCTRE